MNDFDRPSPASVLSTRASDRTRRPDATWIASDLGYRSAATEIEHRVLTVVDDLGAPVDYVVTHDLTGDVPRACAAIRTLGTGSTAKSLAQKLHALLGGTAVVLAPSALERMAIVLGDAESAWDCLWAATTSRDGLAGRCARFPGQLRLTGFVSVRRLIERSAVTAVTAVTGLGLPVSPDDLVDLRGPLRPVFEGGQLVLTVTAGPHGVLVPHTRSAVHAATRALEETH